MDEICKEYGEISGFVLQLWAQICQYTERTKMANECNKRSLKQNPFLWQSYADLCCRGEKPDPKQLFQITSNEQLVQLTSCDKQCLSSQYQNNIYQSEIILNVSDVQGLTTPVNNIINSNSNNINSSSCINQRLEKMDEDFTPLTTTLNSTNLPSSESDTPYRKQFKYLTSSISPVTPSFGVLPIMNTPLESIKPTTLFLTPSPPGIDVTPENKANNKKLRGHYVLGRKADTPLQQQKPVVFNQTSNIGHIQQRGPPNSQQQPPSQQVQQQQQQQQVRRSSRLFSNNNYSVKENNKSPNLNKFVQPRSPIRKTNKRLTKISSKQTLNELNEKNTLISEKAEKIETITSNAMADSKYLVNCAVQQQHQQQIMQMKRQSADGLMHLLQNMGTAYLQLQQYQSQEAIETLRNTLPVHHFESSWVQSLIALAHHEQREYDESVKIFQVR